MTTPNEIPSRDWQKEIVGKNKHSVYSRCYECQTWGINFPLDRKCGNCNTEVPTTTFYDEETISQLLEAREEKAWEECWRRCTKYHAEIDKWAEYDRPLSTMPIKPTFTDYQRGKV